MSILIKNGSLLTFGNNGKIKILENSNIFIKEGLIKKIWRNGEEVKGVEADTVLDALNKLILPGLVNAHIHSSDNFTKGLVDNLPLDLYMLKCLPVFSMKPSSPRDIYLRTLISCIEMLKTGTTTVIDDVYHLPFPTKESMQAVFQAYRDCGMRVVVTANVQNKSFFDTLPYVREMLPLSLKKELDKKPSPPAKELLNFCRYAAKKWGKEENLVRFALAPSAPQRCTDNFLTEIGEISKSENVPIITHGLETKVQAVFAKLLYKRTLIEHLDELGLLTPRLALVHGIWITDRDIELLGNAGVSVVYNPASNLKLGSGLTPLRRLLCAGVNIALGCDGISSNDSQNMFEAMKLAALLHRVANSDFNTWILGHEALVMGTLGGARAGMMQSEVGSIEVGKKADMLLINLNKIEYRPLNDLTNQLIFCEHGYSVDTVIIEGSIVVKDGKLLGIDEISILEEVKEASKRFFEGNTEAYEEAKKFEGYVCTMYFKCMKKDIGLNALVI